MVKNAVCFGTPSDKKFLTIAPGCYRVAVAGSNDAIRYDTRCYFNVRSKADINQPDVGPTARNQQLKVGKKLKVKKTDKLSSIGKQSGESAE